MFILTILQQLVEHAKQHDPAGSDVEFVDATTRARRYPPPKRNLTPCQIAIGTVVVDAVLTLALPAFPIRTKVAQLRAGYVEVAGIPVLRYRDEVDILMKRIALRGSLTNDLVVKEKVIAAIKIIEIVVKGGQLGTLIGAIFGTLTYLDVALYGLSALAEIAVILASDGIALAALLVQETANIIWLVEDANKCLKACGAKVPSSPNGNKPYEGKKMSTVRIIQPHNGQCFHADADGKAKVKTYNFYNPKCQVWTLAPVPGGFRIVNTYSKWYLSHDTHGNIVMAEDTSGDTIFEIIMATPPPEQDGQQVPNAVTLKLKATGQYVGADGGKGYLRLENERNPKNQDVILYASLEYSELGI